MTSEINGFLLIIRPQKVLDATEMICTTPCKILISTTKDDDSGVEERFYQRLILFHFDMNTIKMSVARGGHAPVVMMGKNRKQ